MENKFAYLAGIIDGEGSISIEIQGAAECRKTDYYAIRLLVINTDTRLLEWLKENFGGSINKRKAYENRRQCYNWALFSYDAANLLAKCLPFMIIKKQRAQVLIQFMQTKKDTWNVSDEVQKKRRELYAEMKLLNKIGG